MWFNWVMANNESKTVADLNVGDYIIVIDETVRVLKLAPNYLNGRTCVLFEYVTLDNVSGTINRKPTSWLLFKPTDRVTRGTIFYPVGSTVWFVDDGDMRRGVIEETYHDTPAGVGVAFLIRYNDNRAAEDEEYAGTEVIARGDILFAESVGS